jgi:AcrR family transcriptional regulator
MNIPDPPLARRAGGCGSDRGRPRDPGVDEAIIEAALVELTQRGYADLTVADVARRAGVSKPTVYRRWADKAQLVVEAIASRMPAPRFPDTGDVAADLVAYADRLVGTFAHGPAGQVLPGLVAAIAADPEMADQYRRLLIHPLRQHMQGAVERGVTRGQLLADTDIDLVLDAIAGPVYVRLLITGQPIEPNYSRAVVELVLARYGVR